MVDGEMVGEQLLNQRTKVTHYEYIPKVLRKGDRFHGPVAQLSLMFNHICRCIRMYIVLVDVEYSIHKRKTKLLYEISLLRWLFSHFSPQSPSPKQHI